MKSRLYIVAFGSNRIHRAINGNDHLQTEIRVTKQISKATI